MKKTATKRLNRVLAAVLTIAALSWGHATAGAMTKTVTYTITSVESIDLNYNIVFTRSGNTPFDTSAPTTYTVSVPTSIIGQTTGGAGSFSVELADGFKLSLSWSSGSDVRFTNNCIRPWADNKYITYTVSCPNTIYYYVTHIMMTGTESGYQHGMPQSYPRPDIDIDYDNVWSFSQSYISRYSFGQVSVTYSDVPALSIFESDGENAYKIKSKDDLRHLANYVNNDNDDTSALTFRQTQDITCDNTYTPIGKNSHYFRGHYDGQGHTVSGITVTPTGTDYNNIGLFGLVKGGTVQNVTLSNSSFTGKNYVGGIVGYNAGSTIENCRVESSVTIHAGYDNAEYLGGIAGGNYSFMSDKVKIVGKIIGCVSAATVSKNSKSGCSKCGGIVGRNDESTVENCLYTGTTVSSDSYVGAIAGWNNNGTLTNNYYTVIDLGGVGSEGSSSDQNGARRARTVTLGENVALVGSETPYSLSGITAIGSYALRFSPPLEGSGESLYSGEGQTLTLSYTGAPVATTGYAVVFSANGTPMEGNAYTMPATDASITVAATDVWGITNTPAADGSADHPYLIGSKTALDLLAKHVNGTDGHTANEFNGKHFLQTADITYDGTENNYTPIGKSSRYFRGHYDGGGYSVSGININTTGNDVGLFGYVYTPGTVENVTLANSTIKGFTDVGGIVGYLYGDQYDPDVSNCRVESDVTIGAGSGSAPNHGGIVGRMQCGIIAGCYSAATITDNGLSSCKDFGGIVGYLERVTEVKDCLFTGTIVTTSTKKGGIVATKVDGSTLTNNYYTDSSLGGVNGSDQDGARLARTVTLGEYVALVGSETAYSLSGITAIGTGNYALSYNDGTATTLYSGEGQALTLCYTGTVPDGSTVVFSTTGGTLSGNTLTMPASDVTVSGGAYRNDYVTHWQAGPDHDGSSDKKSYVITTPEGLQLLASETNGDNLFSGKYFKLGGDIDMSSVNNFTPIGYGTNPFRGYFDGDGHTISHLTINLPDNNNIGLFGYVSNESTVNGVTLDRANITGKLYVGGIAGYIDNKQHVEISNCHVVSSTITSTSSTAQGAIVGWNNEGTLTDNTYHSTLAYHTDTANGYAFNIGVGKHTINQSTIYGDDEGGACLDATKLTLDAGRTDLATLLAAYNDPTGHTAHNGTEPDLSNLTATVRGDVTIPSGSVLEAKTVTITQGSHLTLDDGAELISGNALTNVTVKKHIAKYTPDQNGWHLITLPYSNMIRPTLICNIFPDEGYDLYRMNLVKTCWENHKLHHEESDNFSIGPVNACLYATSADVTLEIADTVSTTTYPYRAEGTIIWLAHGGAGWNLIGNPNTFKTYANRPYYRLNTAGTAFEYVANYWQEPIPVCGGIMVISNIDGDSCIFTRTAPETPAVTPATRADIPLTISSHGSNTDLAAAIILADDGDNTSVISANQGSGKTVVLADRSLFRDGEWNTLCLPFSMTAEQIAASPLAGADIRTLSSTSFADGTLTLNFTAEGAVTSITAGTPYIIKWANSDDFILSPTFTGVTVSSTEAPVETDYVDFKGTYATIDFTQEDRTKLFVGTGNILVWPEERAKIGACRAYFQLKNGLTASDVTDARMFLDDIETGIENVQRSTFFATPHSQRENVQRNDDSWYSIDGRKLGGMPSAKGLCIHNGKKIIIK